MPEPEAPALRVTVEGIARDAKAGAVVIVNGERICSRARARGRRGWAARASACGVLRERKVIPDPIAPDGTIAAGAVGSQHVLEAPSWSKVP